MLKWIEKHCNVWALVRQTILYLFLTRLLLIVNENDNGAPKIWNISLLQKLISLEHWTFLNCNGCSISPFLFCIALSIVINLPIIAITKEIAILKISKELYPWKELVPKMKNILGAPILFSPNIVYK